jgi:hypothetical protein
MHAAVTEFRNGIFQNPDLVENSKLRKVHNVFAMAKRQDHTTRVKPLIARVVLW